MFSKEDILGNRVYAFHDKLKTFTVNRFSAEGVPLSTLFEILKRKEDAIWSEIQNGSGISAKIMIKSRIKRLVKLFDHKCGINQRKGAKKMKCSVPLIDWALMNKTLIIKRKIAKIPKPIGVQKVKIRPMCRQLNYKYNL